MITRIIVSLRLCAFAALCLVLPGASADSPRPLLSVGKLPPGANAANTIWAQPPAVPRFHFSKLGQQAAQRAEVRLAYDDLNLYVAFRCLDSGKGKKGSITPEGEIVPDADSVSFLLDLDNDGRTYGMFTTTAAGKKSAESGRRFIHKAWDVDWDVTTRKEGSTWEALMTIPFRSLGVPTPVPGTRWGAQLSRYDPGTKRPTFWARVRKDPREVDHCGQLMFVAANGISATVSDIKIAVPGRQNAAIHIANRTGKSAATRVELINDGVTFDKFKLKAAPGESTVPLQFNYPNDGWHSLTVAISDGSGREIARTPGIPVRLATYATRAARYISVAQAQKPRSAIAKEEKKRVLLQLADFRKQLDAAEGDPAKWEKLQTVADAAEKAVGHLRNVCADKADRGYAVGTETALRKIMRDKLFEGEFGQPARLELARNEFESTQIALFAHGKALENVRVSVSDLQGAGAVIPSQAVALNLVEFVETGEPPYEIDYTGWFPDPLLEYQPFNLAQGAVRPVWITVHTPEQLPAGLYRGNITIKPANALEFQVPLEVRVRDFTLPTTPQFKTAFTFAESQYRGWYGNTITDEQRKQAYQLLLEHRLNPTDIYSKRPKPEKDDLAFCAERGLNAFNLNYVSRAKGKAGRAEVGALLREQETLLKSKGWWDKAFVYGFDEVGSSRYPDVQDTYGWLKQEFPDLPRMCTVLPNPELKGYVNVWVPLIANFDYEEVQPYIKDGDEVWWYVCCGPERPWPNFFVDYPATDPRVVFWMNWKYQVPGFLYWIVNRWHMNLKERSPAIQKQIDAGKRWPEVPWRTQTTASFNGDGHLVYPGPNGRLLSSIRLVSVRDGIDDYEYFYLLNTLLKEAEKKPNADKTLLAKARKVLEVRNEVVTSRTMFTEDPQTLLGARRELAETIEAISRVSRSQSADQARR